MQFLSFIFIKMLNASCVSQLYFENNFPKSLLVNLSGRLILLEGIF